MKKINLIGLSIVSVAVLAGCGGGGNPPKGTNPSGTNTGTGYYVDSAVEGVNYSCGSQTGVTDKDGKFTFEEGKGCTFSIAGIKLREVKKDDLKDGKKVLENDLEVAQFLQSIDSDGDASNGIQIKPEVLKVLNDALKGKKDVPKGDELEGVVSEIEQQVPDFKGEVKTKEEVKTHLEKSATQITKELLAGKTFYAYIEDGDHKELTTLVINKDATSFTGEVLAGEEKGEKFTEKIEIQGSALIMYHDDGDTGTFIVTQKANYIELKKTEHNNIAKLFVTEAEAKAEYDKSIKNDPYSAENLKKYFAGKTFYFVRKNELRSVTVSKDGKVLNFNNGKTYHVSYKDHKLVDEDGEHIVNEITDKYVKITGGEDNEEITLYLDKADAEAELKAGGGDGDPMSAENLKKLFAGNTLWMVDDHHEGAPNVAPVIFNSDATTIKIGEKDTPNSITIKDGEIDDHDGKHFIDEITNKYVKGHDSEGEFVFFFNKADAEAALKAGGGDNNGNQSALNEIFVGKVYYIAADDSYTDENGTVVKNPHVEKLDFKSDGHTLADTWEENGETKTRTFNYSIDKDTLIISGTDDDGSFTLTITDVVKKDKYLEFMKLKDYDDTKGSGKFYYTESDAEAALK